MVRVVLFFIALLLAQIASAQNIFRVLVKDKISGDSLPYVSVMVKGNARIGTLTNTYGRAQLSNVPNGKVTFLFRYIGYKPLEFDFTMPDSSLHTVYLETNEKSLEVTVVASTRTDDPVEQATTKVEILGPEEMSEENMVKPASVASILSDVSGVQIQQSSATSGNVNVRIQGLGGQYTQLLRDGMPIYDGFSGGFGVLSIPPLDLQQLELIKGSASTLYGGGAIGGLINFISKKPTFKPELTLLLNQSTLLETNANAYYARRWKKVGLTFYAGQTLQKAVDVNKDGFSDVPESQSTLLHPTLFLYPSLHSFLALGWTGSFENRRGGDMQVLAGNGSADYQYYEHNKLKRHTFTLLGENRFSNALTGSIKASLSNFDRTQQSDTGLFTGSQANLYTEVALMLKIPYHTVISGVNFTHNQFQPSTATPIAFGSLTNTIQGLFVQETWQVHDSTKIEAGIRLDHHQNYGFFLLPRLAVFHHFNKQWGSRAGLGMGYKTPNPLAPQITDINIYSLQPVSANVRPETSLGLNAEVNYRKEFADENSIFINHAFFFTQINSPIVANEITSGQYSLSNADKPVLSRGFDTYVQWKIHAVELYLGYTYTVAERMYLPQNRFVPFAPRNRAAMTAVYEIEKKWRFGVEGSYNGAQYRDGLPKTQDYFFFAAMVSRELGKNITLVINGENLLDARQSRYETLYTGSRLRPQFSTLWAPIDGRVINLAIRFKLAH